MIAYIALHGRSSWASLNTYYAALLETDIRPDLVWLVTESTYEDRLPVLDEGFRVISLGFDFQPEIRSMVLPTGDISMAGVEVRGIVDRLEPYEKCMDITSARKAVVAGALLATADCKPDHIYYLEIDDLMDKDKPYVMIPRQQQLLHDLREETRRPSV
ncbi:hypothetical protein GF326_04725 [Candidatus Bathyarchaeota archaeon]|nr:hypothetical protein [Candidatus Bathyarchaeota archaeon]